MYRRNANLTFAFMLALSAIALFAPLVGAQKQDERPDLRRLFKPDELRQRHQQLKKKRDEMRTRLDDLRAGLIQQKQAMRAELAASELSRGSASSTTESARTQSANKPVQKAGAAGSTIVVTSTADDGPGTLRQALAVASSGDTINITAKGTMTLVSGQLVVDKSITIRGPGASKLTVSGNNASRVFYIAPDTIVTISGLTITNGSARSGGGIYNDHATKLTVSGCVLSGNSARFGGGVFSNGFSGSTTLILSGSTLSNNSAGFAGGGNFNNGFSGNATVTIGNSVISGNNAQFEGGGIYNNGDSGSATVTLSNSAVSGNSAGNQTLEIFGNGGGIYNDGNSNEGPGNAILQLNASEVSGNSADGGGAGIFNDAGVEDFVFDVHNGASATVTANGSTISGNVGPLIPTDGGFINAGNGGGIYSITYGGNAAVSINNSRVNNNHIVLWGGGIASESYQDGKATLTITKSDISDNSATAFFGGGIYSTAEEDGTATATVSVADSTISRNSALFGGGILMEGDEIRLNIRGSTIAENVATDTFLGRPNYGDGGIGFYPPFYSPNEPVTLVSTVIRGNLGTGITSSGITRLDDCTVDNNTAPFFGGGIVARDLSLNNTTVSNNSADEGAGIVGGGFTFNRLIINNSTISGNIARLRGGGVMTAAPGCPLDAPCDTEHVKGIVLNNSTLAGNSAPVGGGIYIAPDLPNGAYLPVLRISNTVLKAGAAGENIYNGPSCMPPIPGVPGVPPCYFGIVISHGYNLSSDAAGGDGGTGPGGLLNGPGDIRNTDPRLGPLQNNGGPTMTHALLLNSPAVNAGDPNFNPNAFDPPLLYDQRNSRRFPRVVNGRVDIGAYELKSP